MQHLQKTRGVGGLDKLTSVPATQERREPTNSRGLPHSFTRYSARSSSNSSLAPFGRFNSWPRPDSMRYAVSAASAAPSAASFLFLSFTPFTAPTAAPAAAASAASCWLLDRPSISPSLAVLGFTLWSPGTLTTSATIGRLPNLVRISSNVSQSFARPATPRSEEHTSELQSRFDLVC